MAPVAARNTEKVGVSFCPMLRVTVADGGARHAAEALVSHIVAVSGIVLSDKRGLAVSVVAGPILVVAIAKMPVPELPPVPP